MARDYDLHIGSDERYTPKWYERRAYAQGLIDANRIYEKETWAPNRSPTIKQARDLAHARAVEFYDEI